MLQNAMFQIRAGGGRKIRSRGVVYSPYAGCHRDFGDLQPDKVVQGPDI